MPDNKGYQYSPGWAKSKPSGDMVVSIVEVDGAKARAWGFTADGDTEWYVSVMVDETPGDEYSDNAWRDWEFATADEARLFWNNFVAPITAFALTRDNTLLLEMLKDGYDFNSQTSSQA